MTVKKLSEHTVIVVEGKMIINLDMEDAQDLAYQLLRVIDKNKSHPLDERHPELSTNLTK